MADQMADGMADQMADGMADQVDIVVVGLGVGGEEVAGRLAEAGLAVVGIEHRLVGGECPYWGCVPSKMMIRAANLLAEGRRIDGMSGSATVEPDWGPVARRIREEATDNWDDKVAVDRFTGKGGRFVRGFGRLAGPGRVEVDDQIFEARRGVVLGVGTAPSVPPIDGLAGTPYWTNREAIEATEVPGSLLILGGGGIGLELSQVYARFGAQVTVVEALDRLLAVEEPESSALAAKALAGDGITVRTGAQVSRVAHDGQQFAVTLADGDRLAHAQLVDIRLVEIVVRRVKFLPVQPIIPEGDIQSSGRGDDIGVNLAVVMLQLLEFRIVEIVSWRKRVRGVLQLHALVELGERGVQAAPLFTHADLARAMHLAVARIGDNADLRGPEVSRLELAQVRPVAPVP